MATNLRIEDLPAESLTPLRMLAGLYRSTFVDLMQDRFRTMLAGVYAVYVTALGEGFEPPLRAHLTDILQDLIARAPELTQAFEEELMRQFRTVSGCSESPAFSEPDKARSPDLDPSVREFVGKAIRSAETRHGSIILAATRVYAKLVGRSEEDFRPPWTPACLFAAFGTVLERIDVPIHGKVKLALYRLFAQDVLWHLGDACLAFRDVLPEDLSQLSPPRREGAGTGAVEAAARSGRLAGHDGTPRLVLAGNASTSGQAEDHGPAAASVLAHMPGGRATVKLGRALLILAGVMGTVWGGWWAGTHFAKARLPSLKSPRELAVPAGSAGQPQAGGNAAGETALSINAEQPGSTGGGSGVSPPPQPALSPQPAMAVPATAVPTPENSRPQAGDARQKREILRSIRLKTFSWRVDAGRNEMLFDLTIANGGKPRVGGIEIVCSQYSAGLDFLETAKIVLEEPVEPGQARVFKAVPIGFPSKQTARVNCVIADAVAVQ
jgi:hypothetical protein